MTTKDIKKEEHKEPAEKIAPVKTATKKAVAGKYIETVGRRKTGTARVRITPGAKEGFIVNGKDFASYFPTEELQSIVKNAIVKSKVAEKFSVTVVVKGGGVHSQAEAVRQGVARALVEYDAELRVRLKKLGFLKRDPRMKERRKFGLKKARKASQWSKR